MMFHSQAMEEHVRELTHWLGDLEFSNAERLSPAADGDVGGKECRWESNSCCSRVRTGTDMNARSRRMVPRLVKQMLQQEVRGWNGGTDDND